MVTIFSCRWPLIRSLINWFRHQHLKTVISVRSPTSQWPSIILGHYCTSQTNEVQCPKGTFNPESTSFLKENCIDCPKNSFCPIGSSNFTTCGDQAEFFCPKGSPDKKTYEQHKIIPYTDTSDEKCLHSSDKLGFQIILNIHVIWIENPSKFQVREEDLATCIESCKQDPFCLGYGHVAPIDCILIISNLGGDFKTSGEGISDIDYY